MLQELESLSAAAGLPLSEEQASSMRRFWAFVLETNKHTNLTRITDDRDAVLKHFVDSLTVLQTGVIGTGSSVVDIGTGAGFPGIPLKIVRPDVQLTLVDATLKRVRFLRSVIAKMGWSDVVAVHARAEQAGGLPDYEGRFDVAVARAVARLDRLVPICWPFVKEGGHLVAMKGPDVEDEIRDARSKMPQDGDIVQVMRLQLPEGAGGRTLVVLHKGADGKRPRPSS